MVSAPVPRQQARREERKKRFFEVARRLFLRQGYDDTPVESISNEAGYSKRTVYLYFETKHELFCAVLRPEMLALAERLDSAQPTKATGREKLIAMAREYVAFSRERPDVFALLMHFESHDFHRGKDRSRLPVHAASCFEVNERLSRGVDRVIEEGFADGSVTSELTPAQLNLMFWASLVGILQVCNQRAGILESHYRITERKLLDIFIHRFLPPTDAPRSTP